jgi:hypothetical protein
MLILPSVHVFIENFKAKRHKLKPRLAAGRAAQQLCLTHLDRASSEAVLKLFQSMNEHT